MRTYNGHIGKTNVQTSPTIIEWLDKHEIPYEEIHVGRLCCGFDGFYVDDKAIRPSEFVAMNYEQIQALLAKENAYNDE